MGDRSVTVHIDADCRGISKMMLSYDGFWSETCGVGSDLHDLHDVTTIEINLCSALFYANRNQKTERLI